MFVVLGQSRLPSLALRGESHGHREKPGPRVCSSSIQQSGRRSVLGNAQTPFVWLHPRQPSSFPAGMRGAAIWGVPSCGRAGVRDGGRVHRVPW